MNQSTVASTLTTLSLALAMSGCGSSDSHAAQATQTDKIESGETALSSDSVVNLSSAFAQSLTCSSGVKPYFDPTASGVWSLSFDSDQLNFIGPTSSAIARFSSSGNPVVRTETELGASQQTFLGQTGGRLWFERNPTGSVLNAGLSGRADGTSIECGAIAESQWLAPPAASPFAKVDGKLFWNTVSGIALHCASSDSGNITKTSAVHASTLQLTANGALTTTTSSGDPLISLPAPQSNGRTASFVHESTRDGGLRVWLSQHDSNSADNVQIQWRMDYSLLAVSHHRQDGSLTRCVPAPLDPRGSITG